MPNLPSELQRAEHLSDRLYSAVRVAKHFRETTVRLDLNEAEELLQLLNDSLRSIKTVSNLQEHDGTCEKIATRPLSRRITHRP